jgi:hypothetical protein
MPLAAVAMPNHKSRTKQLSTNALDLEALSDVKLG